MRGAARFLIILGAVALGAACTASGGTARAPAETAPTVPRGGTLRLAMPAFATGQFDPTTIPFDTTNAAQELHHSRRGQRQRPVRGLDGSAGHGQGRAGNLFHAQRVQQEHDSADVHERVRSAELVEVDVVHGHAVDVRLGFG